MKCAVRRPATSDRASRARPEASATSSGAIGRPHTTNVCRNRRAASGRLRTRVSNIAANVGPLSACSSRVTAYRASCSRKNGLPPASEVIRCRCSSLSGALANARINSLASASGMGSRETDNHGWRRSISLWRNRCDATSSLRNDTMVSRAGAAGWRTNSSSRSAPSMSLHWRSSM